MKFFCSEYSEVFDVQLARSKDPMYQQYGHLEGILKELFLLMNQSHHAY